eukprot:TRINITY_DN74656_c0_g1_i1.p2 TRINITY_DN74656_c0_g1~~TRINITY_DN74656_c0_g1_i1.p2  ORF type:complete len:115 (-),score=25.11 TRINITY_DN74656_c0_g1_i1:209-553(-)
MLPRMMLDLLACGALGIAAHERIVVGTNDAGHNEFHFQRHTNEHAAGSLPSLNAHVAAAPAKTHGKLAAVVDKEFGQLVQAAHKQLDLQHEATVAAAAELHEALEALRKSFRAA